MTQDGQYIILAKLENYCNFITDSTGKLNRHLFNSNVRNVQIVNGLQTSESIFNYFNTHGKEPDQRSVLVKILITNNPNTSKSIIYATNNQTSVNVTALRATEKLQQDIEDILKVHGIYYDRRPNYYHNQGIPESAIITPLSLASGYICLFYKNPYN